MRGVRGVRGGVSEMLCNKGRTSAALRLALGGKVVPSRPPLNLTRSGLSMNLDRSRTLSFFDCVCLGWNVWLEGDVVHEHA